MSRLQNDFKWHRASDTAMKHIKNLWETQTTYERVVTNSTKNNLTFESSSKNPSDQINDALIKNIVYFKNYFDK